MWKSRALVIDDKFNDGMLICSRLLDRLVPHYFFQYEPQKLAKFLENPIKLNGIRLVFQDLQLISPGAPQKSDYDAAADTLDALMDDTNGPWLLVTWSTWAGEDNDLGNEKAEELFNHLLSELPAGKKPFSYVVIDTKPTYTSGDHHSAVNELSEISDIDKEALSKHIDEKLTGFSATKILLDWESEVSRAVSETISGITNVIESGDRYDSDLGSILKHLATAEIGKNTTPDNFGKGIKEILSSILRDKIRVTAEGLQNFDDVDNSRLSNWKQKTNKFIHLEDSPKIRPFPPGSVFSMAGNYDAIPEPSDNEDEIGKFIRSNFLDFLKCENGLKKTVSGACSLIALDITPPCDHANNKALWNKYLLGIKIPSDSQKFSCMIERSKNEKGDRVEHRIENKLCGDYLIKTPSMIGEDENEFSYLFNSKLTFSLTSNMAEQRFESSNIGRLREQILSDITSWLIRQTTRPGIVELR